MLNIFSKKDRMVLRSDMWNIGFVTNDVSDVIESGTFDVTWMKHGYKDRWFADPYLLDVTDREIVILVEEFSYKLRKGRIAKIVVSRPDFVLRSMKIILELPTHLSFPVIYRKGDDVYVMPENSRSGETCIYKYLSDDETLVRVNVVGKLLLTDATIVRCQSGEEYIFSTKLPNPNGNELQIYKFDGKAMVMDEKPVQTVLFTSNIARNAGDTFFIGNDMYRPAQDCNKCYGNGLNIQKVIRKTDGFSFKTVREIHSTNHNYNLGYHTFNMKNGLIVMDGHRLRFPKIVKFLKFISKIV